MRFITVFWFPPKDLSKKRTLIWLLFSLFYFFDYFLWLFNFSGIMNWFNHPKAALLFKLIIQYFGLLCGGDWCLCLRCVANQEQAGSSVGRLGWPRLQCLSYGHQVLCRLTHMSKYTVMSTTQLRSNKVKNSLYRCVSRVQVNRRGPHDASWIVRRSLYDLANGHHTYVHSVDLLNRYHGSELVGHLHRCLQFYICTS